MDINIKNAFEGFGGELLGEIRTHQYKKLEEMVCKERDIGIEKATAAMIEVGIEEDKIVRALQKHWDLRLSEAKIFVDKQK